MIWMTNDEVIWNITDDGVLDQETFCLAITYPYIIEVWQKENELPMKFDAV